MPNWFKRRSPLQKALADGLAPGGDLADALSDLDETQVSTAADARAICEALRHVFGEGPSDPNYDHVQALAGLFQEIEDTDCPAYDILRTEGIPLLAVLARRELAKPVRPNAKQTDDDTEALLFTLKILALYGTPEGADLVIAAARANLQSEAFMWSVILDAFRLGHPQSARTFQALASPLPSGFIAVALLDAANGFFAAGGEMLHPFDSDAGLARLQGWISRTLPDELSYAVSAAAALPHLNHPEARRLLGDALAHPAPLVQLAAAQAAARLDDPRGPALLVRLCLDLPHSSEARRRLSELELEHLVPADEITPEFEARAALAEWLAHPNELGRPPESVDVVDHRELPWPPEFEAIPFWLLRFRAAPATPLDEPTSGLGLVGSITWSFFDDRMEQRPVADVYALHACWEMEHDSLLTFEAVPTESTEYDALLAQWTGPRLDAARIRHVVEIAPELAGGLAAIASTQLDDTPGWVVLDGSHSAWYPSAHFHEEDSARTILGIHLGRRLLRLTGDSASEGQARLAALADAPFHPRLSAAEFATRYETLLDELASDLARRAPSVPVRLELLAERLAKYREARRTAPPPPDAPPAIAAFGRLVQFARQAEAAHGADIWERLSSAETHFPDYAGHLAEAGRAAEVRELAEFFAPNWQHASGLAWLGTAYFRIGDWAAAERCFLDLQRTLEDWHRCEEMGLLAEIWLRQGRRDDARNLLLDALRTLAEPDPERSSEDGALFEEWFQAQRASFLRLFPGEADALPRLGIPATLLD